MIRSWRQITLLCAVATMVLTACGDNDMPDNVIATNEIFTLTGDSLVMGDTVIYSTDALTIKSNITGNDGQPMKIAFPTSAGVTSFKSQHKLVDALSAMSWMIATDRNHLNFNSSNDLYDAIELALAYTDPELAKALLKDKVADGVVEGNDTPYYPAYNNRLSWPAAAWTVYQVTGDRQWLQYAYDVATATFEQEEDIAFYTRDWLVRGCSSDYTPLVDALPTWMESCDVFSTFTLSNNIETARSLKAMADMAEELGNTNNKFAQLARDLNAAVNENMWNEKHGQYSALIYGQTCTLHAPCSDNRAQALAVLWGIADEDDRAQSLVEKTAVTHCGVNNFYPARTHSTEPCLNEKSWGYTQGLWNLASAHAGNDNALRRGLAALWRAQAVYSTLFVNEGTANLDVSAAISNVAMTIRVFAGMKFETDGIEFSPVIPQCLAGDKHINGFSYRDATLDITLQGCGHTIDRIMLDGKQLGSNFIPADKLHGHHNITIAVKDESTTSQGVTIVNQRMMFPDEPVVVWNGDSAAITNYDPQLAYRLIVNGNPSLDVADSVFAIPEIDNFSEIALIASNRRCFSYTSRPFILGGDLFQHYVIPRNLAQRDTVSVKVNVPHAGDYMISVNYLSSSRYGDARIVSANTHRQGVVALSGLGTDSISGHSNLIHIDLLRNGNTITLIKTPSIERQATPLSINVFKRQ